MNNAYDSTTMQRFHCSRILLASLAVIIVCRSARATGLEYTLKYDALAFLGTSGAVQVAELQAEKEAWSVFVAPEWIQDDYDYHYSPWLYGDLYREDYRDAFGVWVGFRVRPLNGVGFGLQPWMDDVTRDLRAGASLHLRRTVTRISSYADAEVPRSDGFGDSSIRITSRRREVSTSLGIGSDVAWSFGPFEGSEFLRHAILEPYVRIGVRGEWVTTTAYAGGDRTPGTSSMLEWNPDIGLGMFAGWKF